MFVQLACPHLDLNLCLSVEKEEELVNFNFKRLEFPRKET